MEFRGRRQGNPRNNTVGTSASEDERDRIYEALKEGGFPYPSEGVRAVLLAYAESKLVRDAVAIARGQLDRREAGAA